MSKLRDLREGRGLSQQALADQLGVMGISIQRATIANYEAARITPSVPVLRAMAEIFKTTIDDLLTEDAPTPEEAAHVH